MTIRITAIGCQSSCPKDRSRYKKLSTCTYVLGIIPVGRLSHVVSVQREVQIRPNGNLIRPKLHFCKATRNSPSLTHLLTNSLISRIHLDSPISRQTSVLSPLFLRSHTHADPNGSSREFQQPARLLHLTTAAPASEWSTSAKARLCGALYLVKKHGRLARPRASC